MDTGAHGSKSVGGTGVQNSGKNTTKKEGPAGIVIQAGFGSTYLLPLIFRPSNLIGDGAVRDKDNCAIFTTRDEGAISLNLESPNSEYKWQWKQRFIQPVILSADSAADYGGITSNNHLIYGKINAKGRVVDIIPSLTVKMTESVAGFHGYEANSTVVVSSTGIINPGQLLKRCNRSFVSTLPAEYIVKTISPFENGSKVAKQHRTIIIVTAKSEDLQLPHFANLFDEGKLIGTVRLPELHYNLIPGGNNLLMGYLEIRAVIKLMTLEFNGGDPVEYTVDPKMSDFINFKKEVAMCFPPTELAYWSYVVIYGEDKDGVNGRCVMLKREGTTLTICDKNLIVAEGQYTSPPRIKLIDNFLLIGISDRIMVQATFVKRQFPKWSGSGRLSGSGWCKCCHAFFLGSAENPRGGVSSHSGSLECKHFKPR